MNWFTKTLEECLMGEKKEFYATSRDGGGKVLLPRDALMLIVNIWH